MGVTAEQIAKVPTANLHVSRAAFGQVWARARELGRQPEMDYYVIGVIRTCDWLANQPRWSNLLKKMEIPASPVTQRHYAAMPETIQDEYFAAVRAARRRGTDRQIGVGRGALATLEWAWHGSERPPLELPAASAG